MLLNPLQLHTPTSLSEAIKLYASLPNVKIQSGGTFLLNSLKLLKRNGAKTPENVISLSKVKDLRNIQVTADYMDIYAMTTITDLFEFEPLKDNFEVFKTVCRNISTTPIRNMATVGGNLTCRYTWTEMPAVMVALDAQLYFLGRDEKEEVMPALDFFKAAAKTDKIFVKARIKRDSKCLLSYQRVKKTLHVDIPLLSLLITANVESNKFKDVRVGVNNCVAFAQRDTTLESFLNGAVVSEQTAVEALNHLDTTIYDARGTDYKKYMFRVAIKNAILEIVQKAKKS